jgi:hypothetical protein
MYSNDAAMPDIVRGGLVLVPYAHEIIKETWLFSKLQPRKPDESWSLAQRLLRPS